MCLYKGEAVKPDEVSQEPRVRFVLKGSGRKAGDRMRVSAQLIGPPTGYHLWVERYAGMTAPGQQQTSTPFPIYVCCWG